MILACRARFATAAFLLLVVLPGRAAVPEAARVLVDSILEQRGAYIPDEGVYKLVIPREAAAIIVRDWESMSPNLGLNSWFAFSSAIHQEAIVIGEILLLPDELDPVLSRVLGAGRR